MTSSVVRRAALTLRPYQQEAVDAVQAAAARGVRRPLVVLPTGAGKTATFSGLIAERGGSALVLAHRDELLRQAAEKIALADPALGLAIGFVAAQRDDVGAPVVVGSVQTLSSSASRSGEPLGSNAQRYRASTPDGRRRARGLRVGRAGRDSLAAATLQVSEQSFQGLTG